MLVEWPPCLRLDCRHRRQVDGDESIRALQEYTLQGVDQSGADDRERVIGTIRRECLDWLIPLSESHLRSILTSWVEHYNRGRPHSSLGPGVPDPPDILAMVQKVKSRHRLGEDVAVLAKSVLGGLHHEYSTAPSIG
jgi:putative transposase